MSSSQHILCEIGCAGNGPAACAHGNVAGASARLLSVLALARHCSTAGRGAPVIACSSASATYRHSTHRAKPNTRSTEHVLVDTRRPDRHADLQPSRGAQRDDLGHVPAVEPDLRGGRRRRLGARAGAARRRRQGLRRRHRHQPVHALRRRRRRPALRTRRRRAHRAHRPREEAGDRDDPGLSRSVAASASLPAPTCASPRPTRASARRSRARSATACR